MREQAVLGIGDARLRRGGAAADIEHAAFGADGAGVLGHAPDETDLEFERGVAGARRQHRMHREPHRGIEQGGGIAAMYRADRVVMPKTGDAVHHHDAGIGGGVERLDGLHDRRRRQFAVEDGADEFDAGHRGHDVGRRDAVFDGRAGSVHDDVRVVMTTIILNG